MPFINGKYKTNGYKILSGHSIGGFFVTYAMIHNHQLFDSFIAISLALWWENEALKINTKKHFEKKLPIDAN